MVVIQWLESWHIFGNTTERVRKGEDSDGFAQDEGNRDRKRGDHQGPQGKQVDHGTGGTDARHYRKNDCVQNQEIRDTKGGGGAGKHGIRAMGLLNKKAGLSPENN